MFGSMVGTAYFVAPEVLGAKDLGRGYDKACDVWSLGVMAIELAEFLPPHWEMDWVSAMKVILEGPPPQLAAPRRWSDNFRSYLGLSLVKDPTKRSTVEQLLNHPFVQQDFPLDMEQQLSDHNVHNDQRSVPPTSPLLPVLRITQPILSSHKPAIKEDGVCSACMIS